MRLLSSTLLLSIMVLAASCSKNQYAQVEPDDLYFTHKDRQEAVNGAVVPTSPALSNADAGQTPTDYQSSDYSSQHSPVFTTPSYGSPTIQSSTLGSPTIQQYGQQPYYDTSVNPDYLYEENYAGVEGGSSDYYNEEYAYTGPPVYETPQVNNYYYGMPANAYMPMSAMMNIGVYSYYRPYRYSSLYRYDPFYSYYWNWDYPYNASWVGNSPYYTYAYNPWCDPFGPYNPHLSFHYWNPGWNSGYGGNYYNNSFNDYNTYYSDGTKVVTKPRQSRNQVSYEVDKSNLPIQTRRADYIPASGETSGRVASGTSYGSRTGDTDRTSYARRGSANTYQATPVDNRNTVTVNRRNNNGNTVRNTERTNTSRSRTVVVPTRTRTGYANRSNAGQNRDSRAYNANRSSVNRSGSATRTGGATRYSTRTTNASRNNGIRSSSGSRSNTSYRSSSPSRSSGARSSYSPGRSSSSRSFSTPSRSSGSSGRSSYTPSRSSSSSRSSGTRSSSSSSSGRSSGRKN